MNYIISIARENKYSCKKHSSHECAMLTMFYISTTQVEMDVLVHPNFHRPREREQRLLTDDPTLLCVLDDTHLGKKFITGRKKETVPRLLTRDSVP